MKTVTHRYITDLYGDACGPPVRLVRSLRVFVFFAKTAFLVRSGWLSHPQHAALLKHVIFAEVA